MHIMGITMLSMEALDYEQMGAQSGIKKHGEKAIAAIIKEYEQLKETDTVRILDASKLSTDQKNEALELLTLIKKKNDVAK